MEIKVKNIMNTICSSCKYPIKLKRNINITDRAEYTGKCKCGFNNKKGFGFFNK